MVDTYTNIGQTQRHLHSTKSTLFTVHTSTAHYLPNEAWDISEKLPRQCPIHLECIINMHGCSNSYLDWPGDYWWGPESGKDLWTKGNICWYSDCCGDLKECDPPVIGTNRSVILP